MATSYWIKECTTLSELEQWQQTTSNELTLKVSERSSFGLAVEGMALGTLSALRARASIIVECTFDILAALRDGKLGIFDSLFGLALIAAAKTVRTPASTDARVSILTSLWRRVQTGQGAIGIGKQRALVSRDPDEPIPLCLGGDGTFPKRDRFGSVLYEKAISLTPRDRGRPYSTFENEAITFLYEAARNSFEHARSDEAAIAVQGIRGILIERLSFANLRDLRERSDLSEIQREYLQRQWSDFSGARLAVAYTVSDLGPGIHRTLQPATSDETPWERLQRAFRPGETRKPRGTDVESGMGLPKLYAAASRLKALLCVKSGELLAYADFSRTNTPSEPIISRWAEGTDLGKVGTSMTLVWPRVDQEKLF